MLSRQARDKHRENSKTSTGFLQDYEAGHAAVLAQMQTGIGHEKPLIANHATELNSTNSAQLEDFFQGQCKISSARNPRVSCRALSHLSHLSNWFEFE
jgi:hypothetical protein